MLDTTIASPWAFKVPPLDNGVDIVVASGTKSLGGNDRDMWGYIATNDTQFANSVMDLIAMRGGILDWRRAAAIIGAFDGAERIPCAAFGNGGEGGGIPERASEGQRSVSSVAARIIRTGPAIVTHYARHGSLLSFRIKDADEDRTRHFADVLATTVIVRYALSFDGLATKVNHHRTVSEYFTAPEQLKRNGFDRLIRLAVGLEDADDLIAALNWTLHHGDQVTAADIAGWQRERARSAGDLTMGAAAHLGIKPGEYDKTIASLIPHYLELLDAAAGAVDVDRPHHPGGGRSGHRLGALAQRILKVRPKARLIGIDADAAMLGPRPAAAARPHPDDRGRLRARAHSAMRRRVGVVRLASRADRRPQSGALQALLHVACGPAACSSAPIATSPSSGIVQSAPSPGVAQSPAAQLHARKAEHFLRTWAKEDVYFTLDRESIC